MGNFAKLKGKIMSVTSENFPAAFAAMDKAAGEFYAYPDPEWQYQFLLSWAQAHNCSALENALQICS